MAAHSACVTEASRLTDPKCYVTDWTMEVVNNLPSSKCQPLGGGRGGQQRGPSGGRSEARDPQSRGGRHNQ